MLRTECPLCGRRNQTRIWIVFRSLLCIEKSKDALGNPKSAVFTNPLRPAEKDPYLSFLPHVSRLVLLPSLLGQIGHLQTQVTLHPGLVTKRMTSRITGPTWKEHTKTRWPKLSEPLSGKCLEMQRPFQSVYWYQMVFIFGVWVTIKWT